MDFDSNNEGENSPRHKILAELARSGPIDFELKDINGRLVSIGSFSNRVVILNLWATWCGPCVEEFPSLLELAKQVPGVILLAVSADKDSGSVNSFLRSFGKIPANFFVLMDPNQTVGQLYGTAVLPESYVFAPQKHLIRKVVGTEKWDRADVVGFFRRTLEEIGEQSR